jgi:predicted YcjX-like family ATPase
VRCTEDFVWTLDGRPVSAVRGRVEGQGLVGSYPGEVPDQPPGPDFWHHPFLQIPTFQPVRLGSTGIPQIGLDRLLAYLLDDVL